MKVIEFQCPECQGIIEELVSSGEILIVQCENCNIEMKQIISAVYGKVKGSQTPVKYSSQKPDPRK